MRKALIIIAFFVSLVSSGFFSDLLTSIFKSGKPSVTTFVDGIPKDLLDVLETNDQQAGQFVCAILDGDVPGAFENLAEELGSDVWDELTSGFADVTSFIESLPSLAPEVLNDILTAGEDVVSVVEELFTNPGAALTVIEGDVMTVVSDVESVVTGAWNDLTCFFCGCCSSAAAATTSLDPAASLELSCSQIAAAASTTYSPTDPGAAFTSTAYPSAQPTYAASPTFAAQTTTLEQAAPTDTQTGQQTPGSGGEGGGGVFPSGGVLGYILQAWVGILACFIVFLVVL
ncbi:hypothetical protein N431DRAFT_345589 [Stipitochalara longipes BDJ]|nr:hypothetical protein N431DRAFT_345589 [Stipitochalara longipes BDJ]